MTPEKARFAHLVRALAYREGSFTLASGRPSSYYINGKAVTLHPEGLTLAANLILDSLEPDVRAVGGLTIGADPIVGAVVALSQGRARPVSGFLVRKEPKAHGTQSALEGALQPGWKVAVLEDTTTTGGSLRKAVDAAEAEGCEVVQIITLVDRLEGGADDLRAEGYRFDAILTIEDVRQAEP